VSVALGLAGALARPCGPADEPAVIDMALALYREDAGERTVGREDVARTLRHFAAHPDRGRVLALELRGELVGYAILVAFWSNEWGGLICVLDELYVRPHARGRGLVSALVAALTAGAVEPFTDPVALDLEVSPDNHRARALYRRLGFADTKNGPMRRALR
jgi:ribosomal protein S18 acetylase RimI-like enzyme